MTNNKKVPVNYIIEKQENLFKTVITIDGHLKNKLIKFQIKLELTL